MDSVDGDAPSADGQDSAQDNSADPSGIAPEFPAETASYPVNETTRQAQVEAVDTAIGPAMDASASQLDLPALGDAGLEDAPSLTVGTVYGPGQPFDATAAKVRAAVNATGVNLTGAGITVGVLSDSFNDLGGAATDEADGALPSAANIKVIKDLASGGSDEGRAMMQVVHDIAPGANLDFYTAFNSEQDFANGIVALAQAGCKVICDDVTYFDEPFFQTGVVANAIQYVEQNYGVIFVTTSSNNAGNGYEAAWNPIASTSYNGVALTDVQNFGNNNNPVPVETITVGGSANAFSVPLVIEWNQPYGSATSSLTAVIFRNGALYAKDTQVAAGEPVTFAVLPSGYTYQIAIENVSGPDPGLVGENVENDGWPVTLNVANAGTVQGHHASPYAITVGAVEPAIHQPSVERRRARRIRDRDRGPSSGSTTTARRLLVGRSTSAR